MSFRAAAFCLIGLMCAFEARAGMKPDASLSPRPSPSPSPATLADLDPDNDYVVAPPELIADCEGKLRALGVEFAPAELAVKPGNAKRPTCGAPQAVVYQRGPAKIRYNSSPIVSCGMALGLARLEQVLNEEATRYLGQPIARIEQGAPTIVGRWRASIW